MSDRDPRSDGYRVYLMDISYFSGKLEAYLRYKEIPHQRVEASWGFVCGEILRQTGVAKVPVLRTPDGLWLQDTTPIIDWLEARHPEAPVLPDDPYQAFFCRLLEDYADEWLWRPALHYRWSYPRDARLLSRRIAAEVLRGFPVPLPQWLHAAYVRARQRREYVRGDGITEATREHVEGVYLTTLDRLERLLSQRPYLLGGRPSLADFGFFASMFRHFSLDPTPSRIMRERAPGVYAWVARLWNARRSRVDGSWCEPGTIPDVWRELITDAGGGYLEYLHANAVAWREGRRRMDVELQGVRYRNLPVVHYRVWCRERLQEHLEALPEDAGARVRETLDHEGALGPLLRDGRIPSRLHAHTTPPVCKPLPKPSLWERLAVDATPWNPPTAAKRRGENR
jgi:glutathione S-transferase